jgi:hypothetical protein
MCNARELGLGPGSLIFWVKVNIILSILLIIHRQKLLMWSYNFLFSSTDK